MHYLLNLEFSRYKTFKFLANFALEIRLKQRNLVLAKQTSSKYMKKKIMTENAALYCFVSWNGRGAH